MFKNPLYKHRFILKQKKRISVNYSHFRSRHYLMGEILLKDQIVFNQCEYDIRGYRSYFSSTGKRGAVIMVRDQLISNSYKKLTSHSFEESVWAVVQLKGRDKLLIGYIYQLQC